MTAQHGSQLSLMIFCRDIKWEMTHGKCVLTSACIIWNHSTIDELKIVRIVKCQEMACLWITWSTGTWDIIKRNNILIQSHLTLLQIKFWYVCIFLCIAQRFESHWHRCFICESNVHPSACSTSVSIPHGWILSFKNDRALCSTAVCFPTAKPLYGSPGCAVEGPRKRT